MLRTVRSANRRAQWLIGWTAAYALLLQLVLIGALMPVNAHALPGAEIPICGEFSTADAAGTVPDDQRVTVHCPLCLARADAVILPSPPSVAQVARRTQAPHYRSVSKPWRFARPARRPSQPRAPPLQA